MNNHVILCGLGELGFRTLERLRAFGEDVVVVDPQPKAEFLKKLEEWGVPLHLELGRTPQALRAAGVLTARALIATTDDDMANLAIALAAREENPDIRLVVRLFNPRLIDKVEREIPQCRALDVAALSAPVFAFAGMHDDIQHCVDLPEGRFLLRQWRGKVPPEAMVVAVLRHNSGFHGGQGSMGFSITARPEWDLLPGQVGKLGENDVAFALIRAHDNDGLSADERRRGKERPRPLYQRAWRELRRRLAVAGRNPLMPVLAILLLLGAVSAQLFKETLHLSTAQAIYFVVTILTTTGFGDISLKDSSPGMVFYGTGMMLVGAMLMAVLYASITDALLSMRFGNLFGRKPLPQRNHFILAGFGTVGYRIAEELTALGHPIVAIERQENSRLVEAARRKGIPVVVSGDVFGALNDLNLEEASCLMTVTNDDALNLELAIMAQETNPRLRVVTRLFDSHMAGLLERSFGIHLARSPSAIAAPAFAVAASADDLLDAFDLGDVLWCVIRVRVTEGHRLESMPLAHLWREEILLLALNHQGKTLQAPFPLGHELQAGDECVIVTSHTQWQAWEKAGNPPAAGLAG